MQHCLDLEQKIVYNIAHPISIDEIVQSLQRLNQLVQLAPEMLEKVFLGANIYHTELLIQKLEIGSCKNNYLLRFVFSDQKQKELLIDNAREQLGIK
jgi:hypothetical protein